MKRAIERLALDTNAVIYLVERIEPYQSWLIPLFASAEAGQYEIVVSVVTEAEALVKPLRTGIDADIDRIRAFFGHPAVQVVDATRRISQQAAALRANLGLKLVDALVAATAWDTECDTLVGNDAQFLRIRDLPYIHLDDAVRKA